MISITIYLDGKTSECGYKYVVKRDCMAWTAYRTDNGFRRFLAVYGLKINPQYTQLHDMRAAGKGRVITAMCYEKRVTDGPYFWSLDEIPENARRFVSLCNGAYVDCYITDDGQTATVYRPNPNSKNVYIPYNHRKWLIKSDKEGRTMKRYRDSAGRLTTTIDQIAAATLDEANAYYQDGGRYIYEGRAYTLRRYTDKDAHGDAVEIAQFIGIDGYSLFTDPARLGTFLPGVASDGQEITRF